MTNTIRLYNYIYCMSPYLLTMMCLSKANVVFTEFLNNNKNNEAKMTWLVPGLPRGYVSVSACRRVWLSAYLAVSTSACLAVSVSACQRAAVYLGVGGGLTEMCDAVLQASRGVLAGGQLVSVSGCQRVSVSGCQRVSVRLCTLVLMAV